MKKNYIIELVVGVFVLMGMFSFIALAFKVSGLTSFSEPAGYDVKAEFVNIGNLKVRAPVNIAGVKIGEVKDIALDPRSFYADVVIHIENTALKIPIKDTTARILTEGLLGSNYISLEPGFDEDMTNDGKVDYLQEGVDITKTQPAMILENIIGQLLFSINK
jgi:phospholipid/cholesterol/gamma-HCH transport system substrate-binding protein